jgi:hypothetical protein
VIVRFPRWTWAVLAAVLPLAQGCCGPPSPNLTQIRAGWNSGDTRGLTLPSFDPDVVAVCDPPIGWKPQPLKITAKHVHAVWLSPTGATAYGVIYFKMPLPVGPDLALSGFLNQMKKTEGDVVLLSRRDDASLPGIRFEAEGGIYNIRANLIVNGWEGWSVYVGTRRARKVIPNELDIAVRAREHTHVGRPENPGK